MKKSKLSLLTACAAGALLLAACGGSYTNTVIGGTVTGLASGTTVKLYNNLTNSAVISSNGGFSFSQTLQPAQTYSVTVGVQPVGQICSVLSGVGVVPTGGATITSITVSCTTTINSTDIVLGNISGLSAGSSVTLLNNGKDTVTVGANGGFAFPSAVAAGLPYSVSISTASPGLNCVLSNASGTMPATGSITPVNVAC